MHINVYTYIYIFTHINAASPGAPDESVCGIVCSVGDGAPGLAGRLATVASVVLAASIYMNGSQSSLLNELLCCASAPDFGVVWPPLGLHQRGNGSHTASTIRLTACRAP